PSSQTYWNEKGDRCSYKNQFSRINREYNLRGDVVEEAIFDTDDQKMVRPDGIHRTVRTFRGGDCLGVRMFGINGKPALNSSGVLHQRNHVNDRHQVVRTENLDAEEHLALSAEGIAGWTMQYDDKGNEVARKFFDANNNPCVAKVGIAGHTSRYDSDGHEIE